MTRLNTREIRLWVSCLMALAVCALPQAHAACVGTQTGDLAEIEDLAFRDPATALPQLANTILSTRPGCRIAAIKHNPPPKLFPPRLNFSIPNASATRHASCPPAPPKQASV